MTFYTYMAAIGQIFISLFGSISGTKVDDILYIYGSNWPWERSRDESFIGITYHPSPNEAMQHTSYQSSIVTTEFSSYEENKEDSHFEPMNTSLPFIDFLGVGTV